MTTVTEQEQTQVDEANASGKEPVVFVHGLWLLPSSWDRWATLFEGAGFAALTPGWPDDPQTVQQAKEHPEVFAKKSVGAVADHFDEVISGLKKKPAVIGHSFGGLMTEILAGRGLAAASVAISPAPFRGVLPLPISALRSASPALRNPANRHARFPSRTTSSATRSPTPSARTRRGSSTRSAPCPRRGSPSSRRPPPT